MRGRKARFDRDGTAREIPCRSIRIKPGKPWNHLGNDTHGRPLTVRYPSELTERYGYNESGYLATVTDTASATVLRPSPGWTPTAR